MKKETWKQIFSDCTHNLDGARHYPRSNIMHGGVTVHY